MPSLRATSLLLSLAAIALALSATRAHAWTDTEVVGMSARAEVMRSGKARISLEVVIDVRGGWVERFELNELGPEAELDAGKPPTWIASDGRKYTPLSTQLSGGRLVLDFGRAEERGRNEMPRRGTYRSRVVYETWLARGSAPREHLLQLPAWPRALDDVELWIDAPVGSELFGSSTAELEHRELYERGALRSLHIVRPKLPRARPLEARVILPASARAHADAAPIARPIEQAPRSATGQVAGVALIALALIALKRRSLGTARSERSARERGAWLALFCTAACALFGWRYAQDPWTALVALAAAVTAALAAPVAQPLRHGLLCFRAAHPLDFARAKRLKWLRLLGPASWLDAATPCGALLLGLLASGAWLARSSDAGLMWLETLLVLTPLWLVRAPASPRAHGAQTLLRLAGIYRALAEVARAHGTLGALEVGRDGTCGHALSARVRIGALSLVMQGRALAWREPSGALTLALDPATELQARLQAELPLEPAQSAA
jgi:hypothetical protein